MSLNRCDSGDQGGFSDESKSTGKRQYLMFCFRSRLRLIDVLAMSPAYLVGPEASKWIMVFHMLEVLIS
jgi:hypothetical protein